MARANYARRRAVADRIIRKYGTPALLRSSTKDRPCRALEVQLSPAERRALAAPTDSVHLVSAVGLDGAPNADKESLIILDRDTLEETRVLRLVTPPVPLAPGGVTIYWELNTRGQARAG